MSFEEQLKVWSAAPSETEELKCQRAEYAINKAIEGTKLANKVSIFPQGSYRNRTNVRLNSDVDICVRYNDTFFFKPELNKGREDYNYSVADYLYADFKNDLQIILEEYFSKSNVTRGDKAFDIHENTYRIDADVVPMFRYIDHTSTHGEGVKMITDQTKEIINYPDQSYDNNNEKHDNTRKRFRKMVRILKRVRNLMQADNNIHAQDVGSFLIESIVWNNPNELFGSETYELDLKQILIHSYEVTLSQNAYEDWYEVNGIKKLFSGEQPWTAQKANNFIKAVWNHLGLK